VNPAGRITGIKFFQLPLNVPVTVPPCGQPEPRGIPLNAGSAARLVPVVAGLGDTGAGTVSDALAATSAGKTLTGAAVLHPTDQYPMRQIDNPRHAYPLRLSKLIRLALLPRIARPAGRPPRAMLPGVSIVSGNRCLDYLCLPRRARACAQIAELILTIIFKTRIRERRYRLATEDDQCSCGFQ
jgi:hypothetical protein